MKIGIVKKISDFFQNAKAISTMLAGIAIMVGAVGVALHLSLLSWPSVAITLAGTFVGTIIIAGGIAQIFENLFSRRIGRSG